MYAVAWKYPSKAKDAVGGYRHFLDNPQFKTREEAVAHLHKLEADRDNPDAFLKYYNGTKFYLVNVEELRLTVGES